MMQVLELLPLVKHVPWDKVMLNSEGIKPLALAIIKLCLSGGISK